MTEATTPRRTTTRPHPDDGGQPRRRDCRPRGVGWWQPPKAKPVSTEDARHRSPGWAAEQAGLRRRRIRRGLLGVGVAAVVGPVLAFTLAYFLLPVPDASGAVDGRAALVTFQDGSTLARLVPEEGVRADVTLSDVPLHVRQAMLSVGSGRTDMARRLVAHALASQPPSPWRWFEEAVLTVKLAQERTTEEIFAEHLNTAYFGRGAYGVQAASRAYFDKDVRELTFADAALLAGLIDAPSRWDPAVDQQAAVQRWTAVLDGMVAQGRLDQGRRHVATFPQTVPRDTEVAGVPSDNRGHIVAAVAAELRILGIDSTRLAEEGLRVTTTIDARHQQQAVAAAQHGLAGHPEGRDGAVVAIDPRSGAVLAYYGGDDGGGIDLAGTRFAAGNALAPFALLAARQEDPRAELDAAKAESLARRLGPARVGAAASAAGISAAGISAPDVSAPDVSAVELASAYATLAADGTWRKPHLVAQVAAADGTILYDAAAGGEQRFPAAVARAVTGALRAGTLSDGRPVAGTERAGAWTAGFTPSLVAAAWQGPDQDARGAATRTDAPADLVWRTFLTDALAGVPVEELAHPPTAAARATAAPATTAAAAATTVPVAPPTAEPSATPATSAPPATTAPVATSQPPDPTGQAAGPTGQAEGASGPSGQAAGPSSAATSRTARPPRGIDVAARPPVPTTTR